MFVYGLICALVCVSGVVAQPTGCTNINGLYECDYSTLNTNGNIPLSSGLFSSPPAQRLRFTNLPATLSSALLHSDFNNLHGSVTFDTNYPGTLELKCLSNSAISIALAAFSNANWVYDFKIVNCQITAGTNAFANLESVDSFVIENGTIASMDATALFQINVAKHASPPYDFPVSTGQMVMRDAIVTGGSLPTTLFSSAPNMYSLTLEGLWLTSLDLALISNLTNLHYLSLGHNAFRELPKGLFDNMPSLSEVHLYNAVFECDCSKLWMYSHAETTKMKIYGDVLCDAPANWANKKASVFYYSQCVTIDTSCKGLELMGSCISWIEFGMYILCILAFILGIVVLILAIMTKRQVGGASSSKGKGKGGAKGGARKKPPLPKGGGKGPKGTKMGWA